MQAGGVTGDATMKPNVFLRIVAPILGISILPLIVGVVAAWKVHTDQESASTALSLDVEGVRSGWNLAIGIRDIRTDMNKFLNGEKDSKQLLQEVLNRKPGLDFWLREASHAAVTVRERNSVDKLKQGYEQFFDDIKGFVEAKLPPDQLTPKVRALSHDILEPKVLAPAQEYLTANEQDIQGSNAANEKAVTWAVNGLLLLGICGPLSGLVAGFGIAGLQPGNCPPEPADPGRRGKAE